ncbi:MAG: preprotein translocase subunit YajC [Bacteroidales bacterium]|nr:preprotein translocase subunit YajC [Bacteroidales bacterium]
MTLATIFLQQAAATSGTSSLGAFLPLILIFVVFYFFMIRPQNKKQKEIQKARAALKTGDHVLTSGGIYGKIREVKEDSFIIEISDNVRIRVEKSAVFAANATPSATEEKK